MVFGGSLFRRMDGSWLPVVICMYFMYVKWGGTPCMWGGTSSEATCRALGGTSMSFSIIFCRLLGWLSDYLALHRCRSSCNHSFPVFVVMLNARLF